MDPMKFYITNAGKGKQVVAISCGCTMLHCSVNSATYLYCRIVYVNKFFLKKKSVQLIDFTHTVHVNVNNIFFVFKKN